MSLISIKLNTDLSGSVKISNLILFSFGSHMPDNKAKSTNSQPNNPLHGVTLQQILERLVDKLGWEEMGKCVDIRCFNSDPSMKSSLRFLRKTPWAREKVEELYLNTFHGFVWPIIDD